MDVAKAAAPLAMVAWPREPVTESVKVTDPEMGPVAAAAVTDAVRVMGVA